MARRSLPTERAVYSQIHGMPTPRRLHPDDLTTLSRQLPQWATLSSRWQLQLEQQTARFLHDKDFYGCNGLEVSQEMALLIAAQACLLALHDSTSPYPRLRSVLVYPDAFLVHDTEPDELGLVNDEPEWRIGESWDAQRIIVSWPDVEEALAGGPDNVVVHECAHQLDQDGVGRPAGVDARRWASVMQPAYAELCARGSAVIDEYGAESPVEFFAVITECFIQTPAALQQHHPAVHQALQQFFRP